MDITNNGIEFSLSTKKMPLHSEILMLDETDAFPALERYLALLQKLCNEDAKYGVNLQTRLSEKNTNEFDEEENIKETDDGLKTIYVFGGLPNSTTWSRYCCKRKEWQQCECPESERYGACAVVSGNEIHVFGGRTPEEYLDSIQTVTATGNDVTVDPPSMNTPRYGASAVVLSGSHYVIGGCNRSRVLKRMERYNNSSKSWEFVSEMNEERYGATAAVLNGKIYVFGGSNKQGNLRSVERYDPTTDEWTHVSLMKSPRCGASAVSYGSYIYILGGNDGEENVRTVVRYDVANDVWDEVTQMRHPRSFFGCILSNDEIIVLGGYGANLPQSSMESFNLKEEKWKDMEPLPYPVAEHACVAV